jgi:hypothetical protein
MRKIEKYLVITAITSLALKLIFVPGSGLLTVLSFSALSIIYLALFFALLNNIEPKRIFRKETYKQLSAIRLFGSVGTGIALSFTTLGIMFKFQSWPGASFNLAFGVMGLWLSVLVGLMKYNKTKNPIYPIIFKRAALFGGIAMTLIILPADKWIALKYRNNPAFVEIYQKALADPDNKELWKKVEEEREKIRNYQK